MTEIEYKELPSSWAFCFNEQCSLKDTCMKYLTTESIPADVTIAKVVLPTAYGNTPCEHYHEKKIINVAWGFEKLYYEVKKKDVATIRAELMQVLDSRTSYYRYGSGEKKLTPEQQQKVLEVFSQHGYTDNLAFDHYEDVWSM